ncbi:MAG: hypothetical protein EHM24_12425 [Acidobacteria bacterium]|nr:MAG: hypothetical protein EHM24_12425 [Acidobacteriota bacterium]
MNRRLALSAFLALVFASVPAIAQQSPLRGLTSVHVVAEETDENDARCGVQKADIESAAAKALRDGGVTVVDSSRTTLYVSLITLTLEPEGLCVSHLGVSLRSLAFGALSYAPDAKQTLEALLQQERTIFSSPKAEHGGRLRDRVQTLTGRFAKEISTANR